MLCFELHHCNTGEAFVRVSHVYVLTYLCTTSHALGAGAFSKEYSTESLFLWYQGGLLINLFFLFHAREVFKLNSDLHNFQSRHIHLSLGGFVQDLASLPIMASSQN